MLCLFWYFWYFFWSWAGKTGVTSVVCLETNEFENAVIFNCFDCDKTWFWNDWKFECPAGNNMNFRTSWFDMVTAIYFYVDFNMNYCIYKKCDIFYLNDRVYIMNFNKRRTATKYFSDHRIFEKNVFMLISLVDLCKKKFETRNRGLCIWKKCNWNFFNLADLIVRIIIQKYLRRFWCLRASSIV